MTEREQIDAAAYVVLTCVAIIVAWVLVLVLVPEWSK